MSVTAGCASVSMYTRKPDTAESGLGGFACAMNGEAGYLPNGVERNWRCAAGREEQGGVMG